MGRIRKAVNRARFREGDPLRDLHVARRHRHDTDEGEDSDALTPLANTAGDDYPQDPDRIRGDATIVDVEDLA